jgi:hypothetical protein
MGMQKGQTPIFASIHSRSAAAFIWLVEHGADVQGKDKVPTSIKIIVNFD